MLIRTAFLLLLIPEPIFACKCAVPQPDAISPLSSADAQRRTHVVFEGKVQSVDLKWKLITARVGEVIPADIEADDPGMLVSFDVLQNYGETQEKHLQLRTGLGGGDCGFPFELGEKYLVDAFKNESGDLSTSICFQTGLLADRQVEVGYLRGDPEIPDTIARSRPRPNSQLCGLLVLDNMIRPTDGEISLFREDSSSVIPTEEAEPEADGSFCITGLHPGKYFMVFSNGPERSPTSFVFFPGVAKLSEAKAIEVTAGQEISHLLFTVTPQKTYSVSGNVSNFGNGQRQAKPNVLLLDADRFSLALCYSQEVAADGSFTFPQVLPGTYSAIVFVESSGDTKWSTKKVQVDVDGDVRDLSLDLTAN